jgi:hypothetical protein
MTFLVGFVFIILGLLLFLGGMVSAAIPEWLRWVAFFSGAVGVILSVPGVLQMTIGRAKLVVEFDRIVKGQERSLALFMKNPQLGDASTGKKSIWRKLGVKRETIESLIVSFAISEVGRYGFLLCRRGSIRMLIHQGKGVGELQFRRLWLLRQVSWSLCGMTVRK